MLSGLIQIIRNQREVRIERWPSAFAPVWQRSLWNAHAMWHEAPAQLNWRCCGETGRALHMCREKNPSNSKDKYIQNRKKTALHTHAQANVKFRSPQSISGGSQQKSVAAFSTKVQNWFENVVWTVKLDFTRHVGVSPDDWIYILGELML